MERLRLNPVDVSPALSCLVLLAAVSTSCTDFLSAQDSKIQASTQALAVAGDDAQRAKAYSSRGAAYSEKARYGRAMKRIDNDEYQRLFDLAIQDHDRAAALDPANPEVFFNRAQANYDRGSVDLMESGDPWANKESRVWFAAAAADFEKSSELDPKNARALDQLGLAYEQAVEEDRAIRAYTRELPLDPLGKQRLADAYCAFGFRHQQQKEFAAAALAYEKSTEFGQADDKSCPYEPFESSIAIYTSETRQYDKAWEMVHRATKAGRPIPPALVERLVKDSGRSE